MVKRELTDFRLSYTGKGAIECRTPFTVSSVLAKAGVQPSDQTFATFTASFSVSSGELSARYHYLRIVGLNRPVRVAVNGKEAEALDGVSEVGLVNVTGLLAAGENRLDLTFTGDGLLHAGVLGKVELLRFSYAMINGLTVTEKHENGTVTLGLRLETVGGIDNVRAVATLVSGSGQIYYGGLTRGRGSILVRDPLYWWPRGLGIQNLYRLTVNLYGDTEVEDTLEVFIGLSSITTVGGGSALLEANGVRFLPMGAVFRPDSACDPVIARKKTEAAVISAARAGFNTLVVPFGSERPLPLFYELCDAHGIVVIHEISSSARLGDMLLRHAYHTSFAVIDVIGSADRLADMTDRIHKVCPDLDVISEDSPHSYNGITTLATERTLEGALAERERNLFSDALEKSVGQDALFGIVKRIYSHYRYASDLGGVSYLSSLEAANSISADLSKKRLADGACGRGVISSVGPDLLAVGDGMLDMMARPKALPYFLAREMAPVTAVAVREGECSVDFFVVNGRRGAFSGEMDIRILTNKNETVFAETERCSAAEGEVKKHARRDLSGYIRGFEKTRYLECVLREGATVLSRRVLLFTEPKYFELMPPSIRMQVIGSDNRFSITLTASALALGVEIEAVGCAAVLSDNYVDLTSSSPVKLSVTLMGSGDSAEGLAKKIRLRSLYDVMYK